MWFFIGIFLFFWLLNFIVSEAVRNEMEKEKYKWMDDMGLTEQEKNEIKAEEYIAENEKDW